MAEKLQKNNLCNRDSSLCNSLRFPLMCGIVLIHAQFGKNDLNLTSCINNSYTIYEIISCFISQIYCGICVPLFYFISGYLFFFKSKFDCNTYIGKIKRRFHSLMIPYLFWNLIILLFYLFAQSIIPSFVSERSVPISNYSISDILWAFWDVSKVNGMGAPFPIAAQFWFIRNLMVTALFSPIIFLFIKYFKFIYLSILTLLWIFNIWPNIPGFGSESFLFFSLGAYFSINGICLNNIFSNHNALIILIYIVYSIVVYKYWDTPYHLQLLKSSFLIGIPATIGLFANSNKIVVYFKRHQNLANCSFFLYAYHFLPLVLLYRFLLKMIPIHNSIVYLSIYIICPIIIIIIGYYLYNLLYKFMPRFTSIITGGR